MLSELLQRFRAAEAGSAFLCQEQSLSAMYVSDAVDALRCCGENPAALGQTLNFGSDSRIDSIQLLSLLMDSQHKALELRPEQSFYAVPFPSCDARRAEKKLGWRPRTDWPAGLQATLSWLEAQDA
jgi:nucleoside-diphosphate-sugar epimerase